MKFSKVTGTLGLAALAVIACPYALADDSGWYGGGNVGQSRAKIDNKEITTDLLNSGATSVDIVDDERDVGYKLFGGYLFNKNFGLEGGYFDLGRFGYQATTVPNGTLTGDIKLKGLNLDAVGILPLTEKFSAFARGGLAYTEAKSAFAGTGAVTPTDLSAKKRGLNYKFGAGLQYDFTKSVGMRVEAERYRVNDGIGSKGDVDLVSVGLVFRAADKELPPPAPQAAPAQVVKPQPQVVVVAQPPPTPPAARAAAAVAVVVAPRKPIPLKKVEYFSDSFYGFDNSEVQPFGMKHLDEFVLELKGMNYDVITVTGNTDRIGSHEYNQALSMRRAEAVKAYLVAEGVPAEKIVTVGAEELNPDSIPGECVGTVPTKKLIKCLHADRRVEVEVFGTK